MNYKNQESKCITYALFDFSQITDPMLFEEVYEQIDLKKLGLCKINIYSNEGQIAHFHIEKEGFCCCVCINHNKYFIHPGKEDTLNSGAKKQLNNYLHKIDPDSGLTNWQNIQSIYYDNNKHCKEQRSTDQPNYNTMKDSIY